MTAPQTGFAVIYAPELAQYVVERGEMRVVPTARKMIDTDAHERATTLCAALNRVYAAPPALAAHYDDGSPRNLAWGENDAPWTAESDAAQDLDAGAEFAQLDSAGQDRESYSDTQDRESYSVDLPDIANDVCGWCGSDATECDCEERYV